AVIKRDWVKFGRRGKKPCKVWMAAEGHQPLKGPWPDADAVPGVRLKWMQPCFVFDEYQGGGGNYLFVCTSEDARKLQTPLGWVPKDWAVEDNEALPGKTAGVHRKALIVNTPESLEAGREL